MTTRTDIFYWQQAERRAKDLGFDIRIDTGDERFHLRRIHNSYTHDNTITRLSTVAEVLSYLEGWGASRQYLKHEMQPILDEQPGRYAVCGVSRVHDVAGMFGREVDDETAQMIVNQVGDELEERWDAATQELLEPLILEHGKKAGD